MAKTSYGVNDAETVKKWSRKLFHEALKATWLFRFMGRSSDSIIQLKDEELKEAGDRVRVTLRMQLGGDGVAGDGTQEGKEEALSTFTDDLLIDQLRHAVRSGGKMTEQRVPFSIREEARMGLTDWWADRIDTWAFNQLSGNTGETDLKKTGNNSAIAPSSDNHVFNTVGTGPESSITVGATFSLVMIDKAVEKAKTNATPIRPVRINGADFYVAFLHPFQVYDLRRSTATNDWADIQKAVLQGGSIKGNPIFTGALGIYNNTILHESTRVPLISSTVDLRRAIFCGSQAAIAAFSKVNSPTKMSWVEELFDYGNQFGVSAGMIAGMKKSVFNSKDFGTVVMSTAAKAH